MSTHLGFFAADWLFFTHLFVWPLGCHRNSRVLPGCLGHETGAFKKDARSVSQETRLAGASNSTASTVHWCSLWLVCSDVARMPWMWYPLSPALWCPWAYPHWQARSYITERSRMLLLTGTWRMRHKAEIWLSNLGPGFPFYLFLIETIQLKTKSPTQLFLVLAQPVCHSSPLFCALIAFSGRSWLWDQLFPLDCTVPPRRDVWVVSTEHCCLLTCSSELIAFSEFGTPSHWLWKLCPVSMSKGNNTRKICWYF